MKKILAFRDDDEFYKKLRMALEAGDEVEVVTSIGNYDDIPEKLKATFALDDHRSERWVNQATKAFVDRADAPVGLNIKALIVGGTATAGTLIGGVIGGPIGAAVGAGIGLAVGTVAAAMNDTNHQATVEVDATGKLKIKLKPRTAS